jgi:hypothetical protein
MTSVLVNISFTLLKAPSQAASQMNLLSFYVRSVIGRTFLHYSLQIYEGMIPWRQIVSLLSTSFVLALSSLPCSVEVLAPSFTFLKFNISSLGSTGIHICLRQYLCGSSATLSHGPHVRGSLMSTLLQLQCLGFSHLDKASQCPCCLPGRYCMLKSKRISIHRAIFT